jgi:4-amino-4-deoxy-L-arabinose transferase-like glycosyltransferase
MLETGDWLHPEFNGEPRHAKPALVYWLIAGSYALFGVDEWTARLHAPVFSALIALGLWLVGRRWLGGWGGVVAGLVWATLPQTAIWSRACLTDNVLTFFIAGSCLALFAAGEAASVRKPWLYLLAGLLAGLAMWTKGPVGLAVPGLVWLVHHRGPRAWWRELQGGAAMGGILAVALVVPWYVAQWLEYGQEYLDTFIGRDNLQRFSEAPPHQMEWWSPFYYVGVLMAAAFPWVAGVPWMVGRLRRARDRDALPCSADRLARFCLAWFLSVVVAFSLSATKHPQYIQSAYPALALLIGAGVSRGLGGSVRGRRWALALTVTIGGVLLGAIALFPKVIEADAARRGMDIFAHGYPWRDALISLVPPALALAGVVTALMGRQPKAWAAAAGIGGLALGLGVMGAYGHTVAEYRLEPFRQAGQALGEVMPEDGMVYTWGHGVRSSAVVFYSGRRTVEVPKDEGDRLPRLLEPGDALITRKDRLDRLPNLDSLEPVTLSGVRHRWVRVFLVRERAAEEPQPILDVSVLGGD